MSTNDVVIYGAGGLGREIYDTILSINQVCRTYNVKGFIDDNANLPSLLNGLPLLGGANILGSLRKNTGIVLAISDPTTRRHLHLSFCKDFTFLQIIHPTAIVSNFATLGDAVTIQANCIVAANATIGDGVLINAHSGVGHDAKVGNYCSIMSFCDLTGNSELGDRCFTGTGVKILPNVKIAAESYLGAGSVVFKNVDKKSKLLGNPAKVIG